MRPETLSWPTRGSRLVGLLCTITMRRFSAVAPLSFFSPPHEASMMSAIPRTIERCFMSGTPSLARGYKRDARCRRVAGSAQEFRFRFPARCPLHAARLYHAAACFSEDSFSWQRSLLRSEEHTSELQSHSFISYAVFCLKKKTI